MARVWFQVFRGQQLGPRARAIRRPALHLWNTGFLSARAPDRCAPSRGSRCIHHGDVSSSPAGSTLLLYGIAGRHPERDLRTVGDFCTGAHPA